MVVSLSANVRNRRRGRGNQIVQERPLAPQLRWSSGRRWTAGVGQDPPLASTMDDPDAVETGAEPISADLRHYR